MELDIPPVTTDEAKEFLEAMQSSKAAVDDRVTGDLFKDGRGIIQKKTDLTVYAKSHNIFPTGVLEECYHSLIP